MIARLLVQSDGSVLVGTVKYKSLKNALKHLKALGISGTVGVKVDKDCPAYKGICTLLVGTPVYDGLRLVRAV